MRKWFDVLDGVDSQGIGAILEERDRWIERKSSVLFKQIELELDELFENEKLVSKEHEKGDCVKVGKSKRDSCEGLLSLLHRLKPWRKGPFELAGIAVDAEWRSDYKWKRVLEHGLSLKGKKILDIGCNNGYFMFRMLEQNPDFILGIDPVLLYKSQFDLIHRLSGSQKLAFELLGVEHLKYFKETFDTIFSMGIIYHHRNPMAQILDMKNALSPGGELIFETLGIEGDESYCLFPEDRYAGMRNVWFVPTASCMLNWLKRCHFEQVELLSVIPTSLDEQRWTGWCNDDAPSLKDFLDKEDLTKTREGHPAPHRILVRARKKNKR
jgi:tRNA (mo5U34)-methyltransferase